jgi:glucosamine-phosphate N-acetyltransferase
MYRNLKIDDYESYLGLISQFRSTYFTYKEFEHFILNLPSNIEIIVDDELKSTITLIYEPKLIYNISKICHIEDLCVDDKYRMYGYGSKILNHAIERARTCGCYKLSLTCSENNLPFYTKNNFDIRGVHCSFLLKNM